MPVFSKDNELTVSHPVFIETVYKAAQEFFRNEQIDTPEIIVSHIIKGRIPEAIHKPVNQLLETDKTIYYERMAFAFEIPTIYSDIAGNRLNLCITGVRAYNHEVWLLALGIRYVVTYVLLQTVISLTLEPWIIMTCLGE